MNSIAQQAVPKGKGHRELERPQLMTASILVVRYGEGEDPEYGEGEDPS